MCASRLEALDGGNGRRCSGRADMVHCPFLNFDDKKSFEAQEKRGSLWNTVYSTLPS